MKKEFKKKWYYKPYLEKWNVGLNDYWQTAHVSLDYTPAILIFAEWVMGWLCTGLSYIPMPPIKFKLSKEDQEYMDGETHTTLKDWFGTFGGVFCSRIHNHFYNYVYNTCTDEVTIEIPFTVAVEKFPDIYKRYRDGQEDGDKDDEEILHEEKINYLQSETMGQWNLLHERMGYEYMKAQEKKLRKCLVCDNPDCGTVWDYEDKLTTPDQWEKLDEKKCVNCGYEGHIEYLRINYEE